MEEKGKKKKKTQQQCCTRETKPELVTSLLILYYQRSQLQQTPPKQEDPCPEVLTNPASCNIIKRQTRQQGMRCGEGGGRKAPRTSAALQRLPLFYTEVPTNRWTRYFWKPSGARAHLGSRRAASHPRARLRLLPLPPLKPLPGGMLPLLLPVSAKSGSFSAPTDQVDGSSRSGSHEDLAWGACWTWPRSPRASYGFCERHQRFPPASSPASSSFHPSIRPANDSIGQGVGSVAQNDSESIRAVALRPTPAPFP